VYYVGKMVGTGFRGGSLFVVFVAAQYFARGRLYMVDAAAGYACHRQIDIAIVRSIVCGPTLDTLVCKRAAEKECRHISTK